MQAVREAAGRQWKRGRQLRYCAMASGDASAIAVWCYSVARFAYRGQGESDVRASAKCAV